MNPIAKSIGVAEGEEAGGQVNPSFWKVGDRVSFVPPLFEWFLLDQLLLLLKKVCSSRLRESDIGTPDPISPKSEDSSHTIPTYRQKEENGIEDYSYSTA